MLRTAAPPGRQPSERRAEQPDQEQRQPEVGKAEAEGGTDLDRRIRQGTSTPCGEQAQRHADGEHQEEGRRGEDQRVPAVEPDHLGDLTAMHPGLTPVERHDPAHESEVLADVVEESIGGRQPGREQGAARLSCQRPHRGKDGHGR